MKQIILVALIGLAAAAAIALWPKEYAKVLSPDGRYAAMAKYRAYQDWLPMSPGDAGAKEGWILIVTKDGEMVGSAAVDRVSQVQELRWTVDTVELPLVFGMVLTNRR